jgi:radical SAM protein with 4Fe4S-binding SPASM domain
MITVESNRMSTDNIFKSIPPRERTSYAAQPFGIYNIELTNKCPMKCVMCPRTKNMTRPQGFMDYELYKRAIDELVSNNPEYVGNRLVWLHHFGESLLHPRFGDFIRYASSKGVRTALSINPVMLRYDFIDELLKAEPYLLCMSLDGHDDESFYKIRGVKKAYGTSHDRLIDFLARKVQSRSRIKVMVSMIDFDVNAESIKAQESYWKKIAGVDQFLCKDFSTWDGNAGDINELVNRGGRTAGAVDKSAVACTLPWEVMTIAWNGDVVPCCYDYDAKVVLGNMKEQSLSDIWNGEKLQAIRMEFIENKVTNPLCKKCEKLYLPLERRRL